MSQSETIETIKQWGIKSISSRVIDEISDAAAKMDPKLTNGQMIEKLWEFWQNNGAVQKPVDLMAELVRIAQAAGPFTEHNPMPKELRSLINTYAKAAKDQVKPSSQPGITSRLKGSGPKLLADGTDEAEARAA